MIPGGTFLVRFVGPSRRMFRASLSVLARKGALSTLLLLGGMNWVILLAAAAASWCFIEVEPHHLSLIHI